jgi:hypothetical protein
MLWLTLSACVLSRVDNSTLTQVSPEVLAISDVGMACAVGETTVPLMTAMDDEKLRRSIAFSLISAAMCSEIRVWDAELERRQAVYLAGISSEPATWSALATDAAARETRAHLEAAQRNLWVWEALEAEYGTVGEECPELEEEEQVLYLMGLASGSLAVLHDGAADHALDINQGVARQVERGAACLDSGALWGVPGALRASVWIAVPGAGPEDVDPWVQLEASAMLGDSQGVWLARALHAQAAGAAGDSEALDAAITAHKVAMETGGSSEHGLLNDYSHRTIRHESDRIWMSQTGHRTESGRFGSQPGAELEVDFDLDAFFGPETPETPAEPLMEETSP